MSNCIFCDIANNSEGFIYEDNKIVVINDINPKADTHLLFIPKIHLINLLDENSLTSSISEHIIKTMPIVAKQLNLKEFKTIINTGKSAGQIVMHLHFHLLSGHINKEI